MDAVRRMTIGAALLAAVGCGESDRQVPRGPAAASNEEIVREYARALNARDWRVLETLVAESYVLHSQPTPEATVRSREDFLEWARSEAEVFPDAVIELERLVVEGDHVAFWATYTGEQVGEMGPFPSQGEEVELRHSGMHRIEDGEIAETWVTWDNLSALVQLGHWETRPARDIPPGEYCAVRIPGDESIGDMAGG